MARTRALRYWFLPVALCTALPLPAQGREVRITFLSQQGPQSGDFPATSYHHAAGALILDLPLSPEQPRFQFSLGGAWTSSGEASYLVPTAAGGHTSAAFQPGPYVALGFRLASRGDLCFAGGAEARFLVNKNSQADSASAQGGATRSSNHAGGTRLWGIANLSYMPTAGRRIRPVFGVQAGLAAEDGPNPNRELGLFAGLHF